jgi:cell division protein FtsW (lipid II flippase)
MLLIAGVRWRFIAPPVVVGLLGFGLSLWHDPMRIKRIFGWLYLEEHKEGVGYQAYQAMLGLGAGGLTGLGLGNSRQKLGFLPEHHTDFIFSVLGEELGLVATLLVLAAFTALVICGIYIALKAPDPFGRFVAAGITFLIGLQAFINIGVVTSALPNKGLSLPFISYGGSNLLVMLTGIGLLLSIARQGRLRGELGDGVGVQATKSSRTARNPFRAAKSKPRNLNRIQHLTEPCAAEVRALSLRTGRFRDWNWFRASNLRISILNRLPSTGLAAQMLL